MEPTWTSGGGAPGEGYANYQLTPDNYLTLKLN
jgi:hypothetical protein